MDIVALKKWFLDEKRDLPWRKDPTPYQVWISEIMLQQTQVSVVIPYYLRWMERYPTIHALGEATLEDVVKTWEGLGYYSRARNIYAAAKQLVLLHQGKVPNTKEELELIKGLGPYTIGAILSFAFHQKAAAVDANVIRVLTRFYSIEDEITKSKTQQKLRELTEKLLPREDPWIAMEALIELGAKVCQKEPNCSQCPINLSCTAYLSGQAHAFPNKMKREKTIFLNRKVAVIIHENEVLVRKVKQGEVMEGLYEFPYFEMDQDLEGAFPFTRFFVDLECVKHSFTRYRAALYPSLGSSAKKQAYDGFQWHSFNQLHLLPFSSGHRRILNQLMCML